MRTYYQGLTAHGVLNAIVMTFAFSNGFLALTTARALGKPLNTPLLAATVALLVGGTLMAGYAIATGQASVLYTFYPPLQAHPLFYIGLALLVISTWLTALNLWLCLRPGGRRTPAPGSPLMAFVSVATYVMWFIASLGIAVEVVGLLIPWSLGWIENSDPLPLQDPLLVQRAPHRVLLAAPGLRVLVHDDPEARRGNALQRHHHPGGVPDVPGPLPPGGLPPPVHGSGDRPGDEGDPCRPSPSASSFPRW